MIAKGFLAHKCNTAKDISSVGYCSSKNLFYFGLKLHLTALFQRNKLARPISIKVTKAGAHDLTAIKNELLNFKHSQIFADSTYCDQINKRSII